MKKFFSIGSVVILLAGCATPTTPRENPQGGDVQVTVAASFYPLAFLAEQVGGDAVSVLQVTPGGTEPHDYEPSPQQLVAIHNADVFLMNGEGVDAWGDAIFDELQEKGIATIRMTDSVELMDSPSEEEHNEEEEDHGHEQGEHDPHIWLSPVLIQEEAILIRDAFIEADPAHAELYRTNASRIITELEDLDSAYRTGLADCAQTFIVTSHNAFRYMTEEYGFEALAIAGLDAHEEPSAARIAELANLAREKNINYIFFETLVSPKLAETVANEIGAESLVLNPLEGLTANEMEQGHDYLSIMYMNLANLRTAMQCQ